MIAISIWDIGHQWDIDRYIDTRYGLSIWIWYVDVVIHHIDMVILDIDMGYGLMIWEMTVSIWSSSISIWDILSLCKQSRDRVSPGRGRVLGEWERLRQWSSMSKQSKAPPPPLLAPSLFAVPRCSGAS